MRCAQCGTDARESARFCEDCGARLELRCPACDAVVGFGKKFCGDCGARLDAGQPAAGAAPPPASPATAPAPAREDERRWATVLFADLSNFTSMSERMDPEDVKALAHRCSEQMAAVVHGFGGTVLNVMGDAIVAVFGAPVAHEDDAERAVRAGLAIRDRDLTDPTDPAPVPLRVHVGINTGEVVAGLVGPAERRDYTVMGDTVNTAARLMSAAATGTVLVGEETYRSTHRRIRFDPPRPVEAKGKDRPVLAWEALEAGDLQHGRSLGTAPLVGRDDELAHLTGI